MSLMERVPGDLLADGAKVVRVRDVPGGRIMLAVYRDCYVTWYIKGGGRYHGHYFPSWSLGARESAWEDFRKRS